MKITFAGTLLCDTSLEGHQSLAIAQRQQISAKQYLRGARMRYRARGNASVEVSFRVTKEHGSYKTAESYSITHPQTIAAKGDAVFECGIPGDTEIKTMADAVCAARCTRLQGRTTTMSYTITGPKIV